ncbi:MAG: LamG-like jellyroll fold domain-containing protein [Patescibacteria group bacterium]
MTTPKEYTNEVKEDIEITPTPALENGAMYVQGTNVISAVKGPILRDTQIGNRIVTAKDGSEIQKVINKLHDEGGGTVFLKNGRYLLNEDITMYSNVYLQGESRDLTILDFVDNTHGIVMKGGNAYSAGTVTTGNSIKAQMVSYWKFDESSGDAADSHGTNTLVNNGAIPYVAGKLNNGADIEASSSQYFSAVDSTSLDIVGDLSFAARIKIESATDTMDLASKWNDAGNQRSWIFRVNAASNTLVFIASDTGVDPTVSVSSVAWTPGLATWYHLAVTYSTSGQVKFYVNGSQQGTTQTGARTSLFNSSAPFKISGRNATIEFFDGIVDEAALWSREITVAEVSLMYNSGSALSYTSFISTTVFGIGTTFTSSMVGQDILLGGAWYPITAYNSATSLTIAVPYSGTPISGGTYTIATIISDSRVNDVYITTANYGIDMQYAKDCYFLNTIAVASAVGYRIQTSANLHLENPRSVTCNSGIEMTSVSLCAIPEYGGLTSLAGNGLTMTSCLNCDISACYISGNSANGISLTSCEDISISGIVKANSAKGIEYVSGNNNITITNASVEDNTSDGIKMTATSDNSIIHSNSMARNGGYGLNILSGCDTNSIMGNVFASNTSGTIANAGTGNIGRGNVTVTDFG